MMHDNNIFQPLLEDTLYISARYLAKNDIYRFLIKISHILQQQDEIDNDLTELFEDSNWRKVYSGCLALVIASRKQQVITQSIVAAWKNISKAGQDTIPLLGSLQFADKKFNHHLLEFINKGLPVKLFTPDMFNTLLFIKRQGTIAVIIQHMLHHDPLLHDSIANQLDIKILDQLQGYADPHEDPMYDWKDRLTELLDHIDNQGADAVLTSLPQEPNCEDFLDF